MTIRDVLLPALRATFPDRGMREGDTPNVVAVFPAACAEVGDLTIYDDGDEATIVFEHVTHGHFVPDDDDLSEDERVRRLTNGVVEFLRDVFADRVLLFTTGKGRGPAGWTIYDGTVPPLVPRFAHKFVWSGPIRGR